MQLEVPIYGCIDAMFDVWAAASLRTAPNGRRRTASCRAIPMIFHLFRRTPQDDSIASLYGTIVAQARAPGFLPELWRPGYG